MGCLPLGGLYADFEEAFGVHIDLLTTDSPDESFLKEITSEEVLIYDEGADITLK